MLKELDEKRARIYDRISEVKSCGLPRIEAVYEAGGLDCGSRFFAVMEFVFGETLRDHIAKDGPIPMQFYLFPTLSLYMIPLQASIHQV